MDISFNSMLRTPLSRSVFTIGVIALTLSFTGCKSNKPTTQVVGKISADDFIGRHDDKNTSSDELPSIIYKPNKNDNKSDNKNNSGKTTASSAELKRMGTKLGLTLTSDNNAKLYSEVCSWIGTPYRYGGTSKSGVDCSGFTGNVYKAVYSITLTRQSSGILTNDCRKVSKANLQEGDLVFFRTDGRATSTPNHVGVYLKDNKFAHASTSKGVMVSSLTSDYYKKTFLTGGRVTKNSHLTSGNSHAIRKAIDKALEGDVMNISFEEDGNVEDCEDDITFIPED